MTVSDDEVSPLWYLATVALALIGWMVGVAVAGSAWDTVRTASISSANEPLQADGASVAVFTDVVQSNRLITCSAKHPRGGARLIQAAPIALTVDDDGETWHLIALEPDGSDNLSITCAPKDRLPDNAQYAFAIVDGFSRRVTIGSVIIVSTIAGAIVGAGVVFWRRRKQLA